jgi:hypothetical protein
MKAWTDSSTGVLWLKTFLPEAIPNARIMTFGYDATVAFSTSMAGIDDFAHDLLDRVLATRSVDVSLQGIISWF